MSLLPNDSDSDEVEALADDFEALFLMNDDARKNEPGRVKKKTKLSSKKCPIRCPKTEHTNGSLYFCKVFR